MVAAPAVPKVYPFRRLFARLFDALIVELLVLWGCILWLGPFRGSSLGLTASIGAGALLVLVEMTCLLLNVPTPGKWLFSIRIQPVGDAKVGPWRAFDRGFSAFTIGSGCYLPLVGWYAAIQSYRSLTETGSTTWDRGKFSVIHGSLRWSRFAIAGAGIAALLAVIVVTATIAEIR